MPAAHSYQCWPPVAAAKARASAELSAGHTALLWATSPKGAGCVTGAELATAGTSRPPLTGLQKHTAEQACPSVQGFTCSSLSGSHGHGRDRRRPQPHIAAAHGRLPLRSPTPAAAQCHSIEGRRDPSCRGGLPHSCNEFVGALISLTVPWERGKPSLSPWHICQGTICNKRETLAFQNTSHDPVFLWSSSKFQRRP